MNFSQVLEAMKAGKKIKRKEWVDDCYLKKDCEKVTISFWVLLRCCECDKILSFEDIMADDWEIINDK